MMWRVVSPKGCADESWRRVADLPQRRDAWPPCLPPCHSDVILESYDLALPGMRDEYCGCTEHHLRRGRGLAFRRVEQQRALMEIQGDAAKQIWVIEFGWILGSGRPLL